MGHHSLFDALLMRAWLWLGRLGWGAWRHGRPASLVAALEPDLAAQGWHINTAFMERVNLTLRPQVAAVGRRGVTLGNGEEGLHQPLARYQPYDTFRVPHASLRLPLPHPEPTDGTGAAKGWRPRTPAMAAGLTDLGWAWRDVRRFRVAPWPQPQAL